MWIWGESKQREGVREENGRGKRGGRKERDGNDASERNKGRQKRCRRG